MCEKSSIETKAAENNYLRFCLPLLSFELIKQKRMQITLIVFLSFTFNAFIVGKQFLTFPLTAIFLSFPILIKIIPCEENSICQIIKYCYKKKTEVEPFHSTNVKFIQSKWQIPSTRCKFYKHNIAFPVHLWTAPTKVLESRAETRGLKVKSMRGGWMGEMRWWCLISLAGCGCLWQSIRWKA